MHRILILLVASATPLLATPKITGHYAPNFNPERALHDKAAWINVPPVTLRGSHKIETEPATMRVLWNDQAAFFVFNGTDKNIVSPGKRDGLEQYVIGDTAEIFMGRRGERGYIELHATPTGKKTFYFYSNYFVPTDPPKADKDIRVVSTQIKDGWRTIFTVPWEVFGGREAKNGWDVFFSRYDYDELGGKKFLSSYPVLDEEPNFHKRKRYALLNFTK